MNEKATNGALNPARPIAIFAQVLLCLSLMIFFIQFGEVYEENKWWERGIKIGGILSMFFAILIFTPYHDLMTLISSFFGVFVVIGIIRAIYKSDLRGYKITGIGCILLLGLNNYIYYTTHFLEWLPLIQKITFFLVLIWILGLNKVINQKI